ncbi:hypothetical protein SASPL_129074 [Salvia splendens]|uniref:Dirigent protein n=1 Tax=Salvia splendens TaxID=180675 RepID=A0A8X8XGH3_SALSN|nr:hypothetical protein SASPL_129074 [Salvia splendens]
MLFFVVMGEAVTTNTYRTRLGEVVVIDNRLAEGPNLSSRAVGRCHGMYVAADVSNPAVFNLVFTEGEFNGSFRSSGATGVFRLARGYARMRTYSDDLETGISV